MAGVAPRLNLAEQLGGVIHTLPPLPQISQQGMSQNQIRRVGAVLP